MLISASAVKKRDPSVKHAQEKKMATMSICPQMLFVTVLSQLTQKQFPLKHTRVSKTFKLALAYKAGFVKKGP